MYCVNKVCFMHKFGYNISYKTFSSSFFIIFSKKCFDCQLPLVRKSTCQVIIQQYPIPLALASLQE